MTWQYVFLEVSQAAITVLPFGFVFRLGTAFYAFYKRRISNGAGKMFEEWFKAELEWNEKIIFSLFDASLIALIFFLILFLKFIIK